MDSHLQWVLTLKGHSYTFWTRLMILGFVILVKVHSRPEIWSFENEHPISEHICWLVLSLNGRSSASRSFTDLRFCPFQTIHFKFGKTPIQCLARGVIVRSSPGPFQIYVKSFQSIPFLFYYRPLRQHSNRTRTKQRILPQINSRRHTSFDRNRIAETETFCQHTYIEYADDGIPGTSWL